MFALLFKGEIWFIGGMGLKLSYCGQVVRDYDPDRFLLSMFAPPRAREDLWALFAFNHEIAKTREVVSETQLGLIRLQWWRDAIAAVYEGGAVPEHEIMTALADVIQRHDLPRDQFDMLIYAREFDLEDVLPSGLEGTLHYADFTSTPLMKLALKICGEDEAVEPVQVVAVNYALAGLLRAVAAHARQRRCYLPQDLMDKHGVFLNQLYDLKPQAGLADVVKIVADEIVTDVKPQSRFLKASQALSEIYLRKIKGLGCDALHPKAQLPPAFKALRLLMAVGVK